MVAPIRATSLLNMQSYGRIVDPSVCDRYFVRTGNRQKRPYNLPLAAFTCFAEITSYSRQSVNYTTNVPSVGALSDSDVGSDLVEARNKAYDRFKDATRNQAGADIGTNLAERKQSMDMMTARLFQLGRFTQKLRRFDFVGAGRELGITKRRVPRTLKRHAKAFSNNWLEFHFGWSPLFKDIGGAIETLNAGIPPFKVRGSATVRSSKYSTYGFSSYGWPIAKYETWTTQKVQARYIADVYVSNPNLWLANQMGLINPASLAWELVPFSFVVDWVGNVGQYLSSFTDFAGLEIQNPCITEFVRRSQRKHDWNIYGTQLHTSEVIQMRRSPGPIPRPTIHFALPSRLSPTRGLTAATLLIQLMR